MTGEATLSNEKNYTVFRFGDHVNTKNIINYLVTLE